MVAVQPPLNLDLLLPAPGLIGNLFHVKVGCHAGDNHFEVFAVHRSVLHSVDVFVELYSGQAPNLLQMKPDQDGKVDVDWPAEAYCVGCTVGDRGFQAALTGMVLDCTEKIADCPNGAFVYTSYKGTERWCSARELMLDAFVWKVDNSWQSVEDMKGGYHETFRKILFQSRLVYPFEPDLTTTGFSGYCLTDAVYKNNDYEALRQVVVNVWMWKANERWDGVEDMDCLFEHNDWINYRTMFAADICAALLRVCPIPGQEVATREKKPWEDPEKYYEKSIELE
ncbi:hypothetical protein BU25DRAFT_424920 [Macroventuria anomochaeta]|uniref:Uncharacterized protein n=1 Tax=Macroventuria anomochaeta TaxID=301207 RepID=A0ACB6RQK2_9PLEO|nr:uncharacterized protein BU25DRAFT_424920 [Macroventuria anomochaeta]KAF2623408.1 hypothetical protein BU25DRAFT_424920 [Macroventuria anomochaeta]